ncbi:hypothetical protein [Hymenobacter arizonensis]|uniref:Uncharacterized protein n=1 Tax=Hymenobacter arizonensis TaxID=1227077 RepID=A0A1I5Z256_HYMAR|nr:hypothetical protein [Hymenobacter arizonensis]SFQ50425.1 hypothetical protein SAMN04515668_2620 [Hymenobacter arizonensis]
MANANIAIWISIFSFASSLLVVLITSAVTLASKKIDAQQKKDDHNHALRTIFIARKVEAAESAIAKWTTHLKHWVVIKSIYEDMKSGLSSLYTPVEVEFRKQRLERVTARSEAASFTENDSFYLYFDAEEYHLFDKTSKSEFYKLKKDINISADKSNNALDLYRKAIENEEEDLKQALYGDYVSSLDAYYAKIEKVIHLIDAECKHLRANCTTLRQHMRAYDL